MKFFVYFLLSAVFAFGCCGHSVHPYVFGALWVNFFIALAILCFKVEKD